VDGLMNIALVLACLADRFGGPVAVGKGLGWALVQMGHDLSYWATAAIGDHPEEYPSTDSVHTYGVDWPRSWYHSKSLACGLLAAASSFDILQLNEFWPYPIYVGSQIARRTGIPYVLRPAGSLQSWTLRRTPAKQMKKAAYLAIAGNAIMRNAACIQAASTHEAENILRLRHRGPITVIPNGVDTAQFDGVDASESEARWPELKDRPVVLFMSRLSAEKGLDILIPAWSELISSAAYKDALLVIAGPDYRGYQAAVEGMIERHALRQSVLLFGMVRGREKASLLRRADVFVLPSYSENFGIVVAEALACGTPVITTTGTPWEQ